jgi:hypothetical protein
VEYRIETVKAMNPHAKNDEDTPTLEELLDLIEVKDRFSTGCLRLPKVPALGNFKYDGCRCPWSSLF